MSAIRIAQLLGATVAALCLKAIFPAVAIDKVSLGAPAIGKSFTTGGALLAAGLYAYVLQVQSESPHPNVLDGEIPRDRRS